MERNEEEEIWKTSSLLKPALNVELSASTFETNVFCVAITVLVNLWGTGNKSKGGLI